MTLELILMLLAAYLIGSVPTAYILGRALKGLDIRKYGSGNVGATNVMRVLGTTAGVATLGIDLLKGFLVVFFVSPVLCPESPPPPFWQVLACIAVVVGHNWMIFLKFTGGKGVATTAGAFLAFAPGAALSAVAVWAAVVALTRYVSLGSILAGISLPLFMLLFGAPPTYVWFGLALTAALIVKHRANIRRLLAGTERKIGQREQMRQ